MSSSADAQARGTASPTSPRTHEDRRGRSLPSRRSPHVSVLWFCLATLAVFGTAWPYAEASIDIPASHITVPALTVPAGTPSGTDESTGDTGRYADARQESAGACVIPDRWRRGSSAPRLVRSRRSSGRLLAPPEAIATSPRARTSLSCLTWLDVPIVHFGVIRHATSVPARGPPARSPACPPYVPSRLVPGCCRRAGGQPGSGATPFRHAVVPGPLVQRAPVRLLLC